MEFFKEVSTSTTVDQLQKMLRIGNLTELCASIDKVIEDKIHSGTIYCLWGEFAINRELIRKGVRYSLPGCPNAMAWSITKEDDTPEQLLIHCTINKLHHELEFIESIHEFLGDWQLGLENCLNNNS